MVTKLPYLGYLGFILPANRKAVSTKNFKELNVYI
jgi:hypothetical protein